MGSGCGVDFSGAVAVTFSYAVGDTSVESSHQDESMKGSSGSCWKQRPQCGRADGLRGLR